MDGRPGLRHKRVLSAARQADMAVSPLIVTPSAVRANAATYARIDVETCRIQPEVDRSDASTAQRGAIDGTGRSGWIVEDHADWNNHGAGIRVGSGAQERRHYVVDVPIAAPDRPVRALISLCEPTCSSRSPLMTRSSGAYRYGAQNESPILESAQTVNTGLSRITWDATLRRLPMIRDPGAGTAETADPGTCRPTQPLAHKDVRLTFSGCRLCERGNTLSYSRGHLVLQPRL